MSNSSKEEIEYLRHRVQGLEKELEAERRISEGRRKVLFEKSEEASKEWRRAERLRDALSVAYDHGIAEHVVPIVKKALEES